MKYPGNTSSARFSEQFETVVQLFDQWNDCERTVVLCALLKRVQFSNLKFLQAAIEHNLLQLYNSQPNVHRIETNANNAILLAKLVARYKSLGEPSTAGSKETLCYDAAPSMYVDKYEKKEDILNDILQYLPLLKQGNDDAKAVFMNLIPTAVEDAIRQKVATEMVQHIFSYMLIHPAITNDDRRSLSQWLRHLQDHISYGNGGDPCKQPPLVNYFLMPSESKSSSYITSSTSSLSSVSWATVAPPQVPTSASNVALTASTNSVTETASAWDMRNIQVTQEFCDDLHHLNELTKAIGQTLDMNASQSQTGSTTKTNNSQPANQNNKSSQMKSSSSAYEPNDDHHVSFSKNGTEILDFNYDDYQSSKSKSKNYDSGNCTQQISFDSIHQLNEYLTVPYTLENSGIKTRRSNSLTTAIVQNPCSSAENLAGIAQKPRSFSLTMDGSRGTLMSAGSETRLDDIGRTSYSKGNTANAGMSNIGQWLKSLRLHKYVWLFSNLTYDQMLEITEEYLENLGVTKGARHKLVLCIQKLKERHATLVQIEKDLITGQNSVHSVLEELTSIVLTPMKPVDMYSKDDVAGQLLKVIDYVSSLIASRPAISIQDEECVNVILWILERTLHNEAFVAQTNQLKEHKYKLSKVKMQFAPKSHYVKSVNGGNGNINKLRWTTNQAKHKSNSSEGLKPHRKNSATSMGPPPSTHFMQQSSNGSANGHFATTTVAGQPSGPLFHDKLFYHLHPSAIQQAAAVVTLNGLNNNNYSKSSSYPNFNAGYAPISAANASVKVQTAPPQQVSANVPPATTQQQQQQQPSSTVAYHRHSLSNLMASQMITSTTTAVTPQMAVKTEQRNSLEKQYDSSGGATRSSSSSIGDINSRLEFLCLQMTEQAIN